jgi:hypothetical protein
VKYVRLKEIAAWEEAKVHLRTRQTPEGYGICFAIWDLIRTHKITEPMKETMIARLPKRRIGGSYCWPLDDLGIRERFCDRMIRKIALEPVKKRAAKKAQRKK